VRAEALEDDVESRPARGTMEGAVVGSTRLQQEAQQREVVFEAFEAEVGEGLGGWALAGVGTVGQQQLCDAKAEAIDHLRLLGVAAHRLSQQEDDVGENSVTIFGGGSDIRAWRRGQRT